MTTIENNKIIALFMGWDEKESGLYPHPQCNYDHKGEPIQSTIGPYKGDKPLYMYHQSYDWLMPVGKKINELSINDRHISCVNGAEYHLVMIKEAVSDFDIDLAYKSMIGFINWYNLNK